MICVIPPHAEEHLRNSFISWRQGAPSKILPGHRMPDAEEFFCPACGIENEPPRHGVFTKCGRCTLHWVCFGNSMHVWKMNAID